MSATPNIQRIIDDVTKYFHLQKLTFQTYNRRHIGNNRLRPWSQHAGSEPAKGYYGNAVDIFDPNDSWDSALLDQVHEFLWARRNEYRIRVMLWKVDAHHDHIHVDTWPKMKDNFWYSPPPKGALVTIEEDGSEHPTFDTYLEEQEVEYLQLNDVGDAVAKVQKAINGYRKKFAPALPQIVVDGVFGTVTRDAVADYQKAAQLPRYDAGIVGQLTMNLLMEFVQDWADPPQAAVRPHRHEQSGGMTGPDIEIVG